METLQFRFDETGETVEFCIVAKTQMNEIAYLLVIDAETMDSDEQEAYILKAVEMDDEDIIYEIVDDDAELAKLEPRFDELLKYSDYEVE